MQRIVNRVLEEGLTHKDAKGKVKRYFTELYLRQERANNIRIYGKDVYIFRYETLITVIHLPCEILNALLNNREKKKGRCIRKKNRKSYGRPCQAESGHLSYKNDDLLLGP